MRRKETLETLIHLSSLRPELPLATRYHSKDLVIFNPEQKRNKEEAAAAARRRREEGKEEVEAEEGDLLRAGEKFASNVSLARDNLFKNGIALGSS